MKNPTRKIETLDTRIEFRVSKEEKKQIYTQAKALGLSVSDYIRRLLAIELSKQGGKDNG